MITNAATLVPPGALVGTNANDLHDIRPPMAIPNFWIWLWIALAVLAVAGTAVFIMWHLRKKARILSLPPVIPPHERARQRLQEALDLIAEPRPFCIAVSDTIRFYVEERFNFRAPERTTEEFLHELRSNDLLLPDQKQSLGEFLAVCDMVKFARYEPGRPELESLHQSALRLVDETEPQPEPAPGEQVENSTQPVETSQ